MILENIPKWGSQALSEMLEAKSTLHKFSLSSKAQGDRLENINVKQLGKP